MSDEKTQQLVASMAAGRDVETSWPITTPENLPVALGGAATMLAQLAKDMRFDDISLSVDIPGGLLSFRAYRRERR